MKSKTVASIMRHVASKLPSVAEDTPGQSETPTTPGTGEKEVKKSRKARKDGHEEDVAEEADLGSGPNEEERLERLYEQVAWPLGKKYGHPYDAFKLALSYVCLSFLFVSRNSFHDIYQRTGDCIRGTLEPNTAFRAYNTNEYDRTTADTPANQVTC
jgi:hypothetical protein